jgi:hypothetical protein
VGGRTVKRGDNGTLEGRPALQGLSRNLLYHGREQPPPVPVSLRAGPLELLYQEGELRCLRLGEREVLRRIYVAVRDRNWGTVPGQLSALEIDAAPESFSIEYLVEHRQGELDFAWRGSIRGEPDGTVSFEMEGQARTDFQRNRIGFCVLHPIRECAGRGCRVERVDGTVAEGKFPLQIAPQQPFTAMRGISHEVAPGLWAEVRFSGEVFEMEDQRNWTDASFKTYGTPLALPYPVEVRRGTRVSQQVTLRLWGGVPAPERRRRAVAPVLIELAGETAGPLPCVGLGVASHGRALSERELARLAALRLAHLRLDLDLALPSREQRAALHSAATEAAALGASLELALTLSGGREEGSRQLQGLASLLAGLAPPLCRILVFHRQESATSAPWLRLARELLEPPAPQPSIPIGGGTDAFFAELNRSRPDPREMDLVSYSINPQVHAFDDASLMQTLQVQAATVASARGFCGSLPIAVSPVTLKMRFNPNAGGPGTAPAAGELPPQVDARQMALFGLAWTVGSLKYLSESGAHSLTYYETTGWRGVMESESGPPLPEAFPSLPGAVYPLYFAFSELGAFRGGRVLPVRSGSPLRVEGFAFRRDERTRMLLANMSPVPQAVRLAGLSGEVEIAVLDERNAVQAMRAPQASAFALHRARVRRGKLALVLLPYAFVRVDWRVPTG